MKVARSASPGLDALARLLRGRRLVVLTGAGCSTESGIPDYRGPTRRRRDKTPILYGEFLRSPAARARYWAGSAIGWPRIARARPNPAHRTLARLERAGIVAGVITQNVDRLHRAAGSRAVVELHGALERVVCLDCGVDDSRAAVQERLLALNPGWRGGADGIAPDVEAGRAPDGDADLAPDGDAEISDAVARGFQVPDCRACGGLLKPDVVFFGENVPRERVGRAWQLYERGDALLVVGSSLTVYSGRRFVERAARDGVPIAIVNLGPTRGDPAARVRVEGHAGRVLPRLAGALLESRSTLPA